MRRILNKKIILKILFLSLPPFCFTGFIFFSNTKSTARLISDYKKAKKEKDCSLFQKLYNNHQFSLKDLARIRAYKLCPGLPDPDFNWNEFPEWMKKLALQAWFHRASKNKNKQEFISASWALSKFTKHYEEKIRYAYHAIKIAKQINSPKKEKIIQYLYSVSPSHNTNPSFKDFLKTARDYKKRNFFKHSIKYYRKALNSKKSTAAMKQESFKQLKWLYKNTKQRKKYLKAVSEMNAFQKKIKKKTPKLVRDYFKDQIILAKNYWNSNKNKSALNILRKITKTPSAHFMFNEVYWLMGKIYEEQAQFNKAVEFFEKGKTASPNTAGEIYQKLIWSLAWNARKLKQYTAALNYLNELEAVSQSYSPQFAFWKAQVLEEVQQKDQAKLQYESLIDQAPFSFHGIIAHKKINRPLTLDLISIKPKKDDPYRLVDDLSLAGEKSLVLVFVKHKLNEYKDKPFFDQEHLLQLFRRTVNLGIYLPFFQFVGRLSVKEKSQFIKKYAYTLFPIVYQEEVKKASQLFNTSQKIIYSIMRQESAFNPRARSTANAVGLMQILPSVAKDTARKKGIAFRRFYDLYDPKTNILLGAAYYQTLIKKHGGYMILNTASYNAGHKAVNKWMQKFSTKDPIEFIQNIPYKETKNYVRLIVRNLILYELLEAPENQINFPNWILDLPDNNTPSA